MLPQVPFTGNPENRKCLKLLVAVSLTARPTVVHLTGSTYNGCPTIKENACPDGTLHTDLSAEEYCDALDVIFKEHGLRRHRGQRRFVWHDRARQHSAKLTKAWLEQHALEGIMLPARSSDLDPLDYGVFGGAKRWLRHRLHAEGVSWDEACRDFVARLRSIDAGAVIRELPLRLQTCVQSDGNHLEQQLALLKHRSGST